jgi:hypothetical protein
MNLDKGASVRVNAAARRSTGTLDDMSLSYLLTPTVIHFVGLPNTAEGGASSWSVYCGKTMLATYEGVVSVQAQLNELGRPHCGNCDGWGTFGNGGAR